jgi:hypothetical protein
VFECTNVCTKKSRPKSSNGVLFLFRVGFDGRLTLEKRLQGSFISVEKIRETKGKILSVPLK